MTTDRHLYLDYLKLTGEHRPDLLELDSLPEEQPTGRWVFHDGIALLWGIIRQYSLCPRPEKTHRKDLTRSQRARLSVLQGRIYRRLEHLERSYRPDPDQNDCDESEIPRTYANVAVARAYILMARDGYNEEVVDCLTRARQPAQHAESVQSMHGPPESDGAETIDTLSTYALCALLDWHLYRAFLLRSEHARALGHLANALGSLACALQQIRFPINPEYTAGQTDAKGEPSDWLRFELEWRDVITHYLSPPWLQQNPLEAVQAARQLISHPPGDVNWQDLAANCSCIGRLWEKCFGAIGVDALGTDFLGRPIHGVWMYLEGMARSKMSPDDLQRYVDKLNTEESVRRLTSYVFTKEQWHCLPDVARDYLVEAERTWYLDLPGRLASVLNHLQVVAETLGRPLIWERYCELAAGDELSKLEEYRRTKRIGPRNSPNLTNIAWVCGRARFSAIAQTMARDDTDRRYLVTSLGKDLSDLAARRNDEQHHPGNDVNRQDLQAVVHRFLGFGCRGVLPLLADAYARLERRTARKPMARIHY